MCLSNLTRAYIRILLSLCKLELIRHAYAQWYLRYNPIAMRCSVVQSKAGFVTDWWRFSLIDVFWSVNFLKPDDNADFFCLVLVADLAIVNSLLVLCFSVICFLNDFLLHCCFCNGFLGASFCCCMMWVVCGVYFLFEFLLLCFWLLGRPYLYYFDGFQIFAFLLLAFHYYHGF